jgi:NTE family protein
VIDHRGSQEARPDVALVLGAGGPVGHAFHAGVLHALADGCGWDPRRADLIVGTSAGAQAGALLRAGRDVDHLRAGATGRPSSHEGARFIAAVRRLHTDRSARLWPASVAYLRGLLGSPWRARPGRFLAALLPEGARSNAPLGEAFTSLYRDGWPERPLWITTVHLDSGERVVFGRSGSPDADVGTAVRCSSAIPGLRRPVRHGGHRYVDGGIASPTHLDLLADAAPRLAVVVSPLSRFAPLRLLLRLEMRALRRRGVRLAVFEPDGEVVAAMGWNPLDASAAPGVAEAAYRSARRQLEDRRFAPLRERLLGATGATSAPGRRTGL